MEKLAQEVDKLSDILIVKGEEAEALQSIIKK